MPKELGVRVFDVIHEILVGRGGLTSAGDNIPTFSFGARGLLKNTEMPLARFGRRAFSRCFVAGWIALLAGALNHAQAQQFVPPPPPPAPPPVFNPSTPYTLPSARETPVAPGLPSVLPDSSFCSVFDSGPCFPQFLPPIGQDLRLTIVSTDDNDSANTPAGANKSTDDTDKTAHDKSLDSIREMYAALRACWTPAAEGRGAPRHGIHYPFRLQARRRDHRSATQDLFEPRSSGRSALKRCTPLHFSRGMAGAVAGRPIAIRFVDERTLANSIDKAKSPQ
jgi:hypothetical protein